MTEKRAFTEDADLEFQEGRDRSMDYKPINPWLVGCWIVAFFGVFIGLVTASSNEPSISRFGFVMFSIASYAALIAVHVSAMRWEPPKRRGG